MSNYLCETLNLFCWIHIIWLFAGVIYWRNLKFHQQERFSSSLRFSYMKKEIKNIQFEIYQNLFERGVLKERRKNKKLSFYLFIYLFSSKS